MCEPMMVL